jgi:hypothetical protein
MLRAVGGLNTVRLWTREPAVVRELALPDATADFLWPLEVVAVDRFADLVDALFAAGFFFVDAAADFAVLFAAGGFVPGPAAAIATGLSTGQSRKIKIATIRYKVLLCGIDSTLQPTACRMRSFFATHSSRSPPCNSKPFEPSRPSAVWLVL